MNIIEIIAQADRVHDKVHALHDIQSAPWTRYKALKDAVIETDHLLSLLEKMVLEVRK